MSSSIPEKPSVREILSHYDSLGIPHFQRGLVWGEENTSLLLESLYLGTPCGTIILWDAKKPEDEGIPLSEAPSSLNEHSESRKPEYLIIDGQQRIRSLRNTLGAFVQPPIFKAVDASSASEQRQDDEDNSEGAKPSVGRVWCVNLKRVPELSNCLRRGMPKYPMFCLTSDPLKEAPRRRYNLIPLSMFFRGRDTDSGLIQPTPFENLQADLMSSGLLEPEAVGAREVSQSAGVMRKILETGKRIGDLLDERAFFLKILVESSPDERQQYHLAEVVALYNRINSAGRRVEPEEKAFATLVSLHSETSEWLRNLFNDIHRRSPIADSRVDVQLPAEGSGIGLANRAPAEDLERDAFLKRLKERNFGFKLFIRTFIQACAYHLRSSLGSNSFSFDVINSSPFQVKLRNEEETKQLLQLTREVVLAVRKTLSGLYCDDLQMLPDTTSLLPLFQILIRFPQLMRSHESCAKALQCLALRLLLYQNLSQAKILLLIKEINLAKTAGDCLRKLDGSIPGPEGEHDRVQFASELGGGLEGANSLSDRYVLMLYWLLRKRGAYDFSYRNLSKEKQSRLVPGTECTVGALREAATPEKQHIVPYHLLQRLYNIDQRGRISRHKANNVGNLTFISHELNYYKTGLGSDPITLNLDLPGENLQHHFLATAEAEGKVGEAYERALDELEGPAVNQAGAQKAFEEDFCRRRRELITEAFVGWVKELSPLTITETIVPEEPFVDRNRGTDTTTAAEVSARLVGELPPEILGRLKEEAEGTPDGRIREGESGQTSLGIRFWGLAGLTAKDTEGALALGLYLPDAILRRDLRGKKDEAICLFRKHFSKEEVSSSTDTPRFQLPPITATSDPATANDLVDRLVALYRGLDGLRRRP